MTTPEIPPPPACSCDLSVGPTAKHIVDCIPQGLDALLGSAVSTDAVEHTLLDKIARVRELHGHEVAYADDVAEGADGPVPDDYERHYCSQDGETWPCSTIRAIDGGERP